MDTATQALLGAVVGQAGFAHRLGRRAVVWGAVGGLIPDLDVLAVATHGPFGEFLYHRGPTHALWFGPVVGPLLGWLAWRGYARRPRAAPAGADGKLAPGDPSLRNTWMALFTLAIFTHPLIDWFTVYGTQLLAPFSSQRFALNGVGIIDPFYSGVLIAGLVAGFVWRTQAGRRRARVAAGVALAVSSAYLVFGFAMNQRAERAIRAQLAAEGQPAAEVRVYPTLLQPFLRRVVARLPGELRVGLYTPFREGGPVWARVEAPPPHPLVDALARTREGSIFIWFAMGEVYPRVRAAPGGAVVELDDLRYGFPGRPDQGMWGIRARFDPAGRLRGPILRYSRPAPGSGLDLVGGLWRATWGDFSGFAR